ncbi:hypothetical protein LFM09_17145 [Lentzea alba]|uniref:hypothetical protein n=1 Tax=Lentzea alba TaxID=2714351 RepID=UPI0039BF7D6D
MTDALWPVEQALVDHVERGDLLELTDDVHIRAWVVRDVLRGRLAPAPDPHGLRIKGARIVGRLDLENVTSAIGLELEDCVLAEGVIARDAQLPAFTLVGCRLEHPDEPALDADRIRVEQVLLCDNVQATTGGTRAAISLANAKIGGSLICRDVRLRNTTGPALNATGLHTGRDVQLHGFDAVGAGKSGTFVLADAHVCGHLKCAATTLRNDSGPALMADGLQVDGRVLWGPGFTAAGAGGQGAARLLLAEFGGWQGHGVIISNDSGPGLLAGGLRVERDVMLKDFAATGGAHGVAADLTEVTVGGGLYLTLSRLDHADPAHRLRVDRLVYSGVPLGIGAGEWLTLLREGTPEYEAQPYQQLAAGHRAAGHDREARRALMAQRRDQIDRRALTGRGERAWARFTGLTLGYGYQPWRALLVLLAVLVTSALLAVVLGGTGLVQPRAGASPVTCPVIDRIAVGLELGAPLITTPARVRCEATNSGAGQALTIAGWVLRLLAWAFATLFIAGFTGAVRRT